MKKGNLFARIIRAAAFISAVSGMLLILVTSIRDGNNFYILSYFTIQSNILVILFLTAEILNSSKYQKTGKAPAFFHPSVHGAVTLYIFITGIVFNTMLAPFMEISGIDILIMNLTHSATPLLFTADYIFNRKRGMIFTKHLKFWLIYPSVYLAESIIEGAVTEQFRYPFLDFIHQTPASFIIQLIIVIIAFILFGFLIILIDKKQNLQPERS